MQAFLFVIFLITGRQNNILINITNINQTPTNTLLKIDNMKYALSLVTLFTLLFISCGPSQKITSSWINPELKEKPGYKKIFIIALAQNPGYKATIEQELAYAATKRKKQVIKSSEFFQPDFTSAGTKSPVDKEVILAKVREAGCDVILTIALVDKKSETHYVPGTTAYSPYMGYGGGYGAIGFGGYYGHTYSTMYSTPGYYDQDNTYFLQANLFDAATEKMIWAAQSEAYDPSKISTFSKDYTALLVERLDRDISQKFKK